VAIPNFLVLEFFEPDEVVFREIIDGGLRREQAVVHPPTGPGLGVEITEEFLRKYRFDEAKTRQREMGTFDTLR
jgi:L-alanine-DL-glutamate epimerase-like enolase superfamily enzyme